MHLPRFADELNQFPSGTTLRAHYLQGGWPRAAFSLVVRVATDFWQVNEGSELLLKVPVVFLCALMTRALTHARSPVIIIGAHIVAFGILLLVLDALAELLALVLLHIEPLYFYWSLRLRRREFPRWWRQLSGTNTPLAAQFLLETCPYNQEQLKTSDLAWLLASPHAPKAELFGLLKFLSYTREP